MIVGIGCDMVKISRLEKYLEPLEKRILSKEDYKRSRSFSLERRLEFLAGRFALKEALIKAFHGKRTADSFTICTNSTNEPYIQDEKYSVFCSIAHEKEYAVAYAVVEL